MNDIIQEDTIVQLHLLYLSWHKTQMQTLGVAMFQSVSVAGLYCCWSSAQSHFKHADLRIQSKGPTEIVDSVTTKLGKVNFRSELYQMVRPQCRPLRKPCSNGMTNT